MAEFQKLYFELNGVQISIQTTRTNSGMNIKPQRMILTTKNKRWVISLNEEQITKIK